MEARDNNNAKRPAKSSESEPGSWPALVWRCISHPIVLALSLFGIALSLISLGSVGRAELLESVWIKVGLSNPVRDWNRETFSLGGNFHSALLTYVNSRKPLPSGLVVQIDHASQKLYVWARPDQNGFEWSWGELSTKDPNMGAQLGILLSQRRAVVIGVNIPTVAGESPILWFLQTKAEPLH